MGKRTQIPRYIIPSSRSFKCSLDYAKRSYYRSLNAIFGEMGRSASEEVVLQLVATECLPILMYGSEACCLTQSNIRSLDFAVNRFLMKSFETANINIIKDCIPFLDFKLPSTLLLARTQTFLSNYTRNDNSICKLLGSVPATVHSR
jgi:hypothetical protein